MPTVDQDARADFLRGRGGQSQPAESDPIDTEAPRKRVATVVARGALVGVVLRPVACGRWEVVNAAGSASNVQSLQAAEALVYGVEIVRADIAALTGRARFSISAEASHA